MSRSPSIVIAYLMWKYKLTYKEAVLEVKQNRSFINPNENFIKQLLKFEKNLLENNFKLI
jgi:protein-tyrosine phosphatase